VDITDANFNQLFRLGLRSLRKDAYFLGNRCFQCFMLDIRDQHIVFFRIVANVMNIDKFTPRSLALLLALAVEISLWIQLRGRKASSDRLVARSAA